MLETLFGSKTRAKILALFFEDEASPLYVQQVAKRTENDPANTQRELKKLEELGVLKSESVANQKYFSLNKDCEYLDGFRTLFVTYNKEHAGEKWFCMEEMPDYYPMLVANAMSVGRGNDVYKEYGLKERFTKILSTYDDGFCSLNMIKGEFNALAREVVEKMIHNPDWAFDYSEAVRTKAAEVFEASNELLKQNLSKLSKQELYKTYHDYYSTYETLHRLHWIQTLADFGDNLFSKYLMSYLKERVKDSGYSLGDVFSTLTTPLEESLANKEHRDLLMILKEIEADPKMTEFFKTTETRLIEKELAGVSAALDNRLAEHATKYGWLGYGALGPGWGKAYFIDILSSLLRQNAQAEVQLVKIEKDYAELEKRHKQLITELDIDALHQKLFEVAQRLVHDKAYRKDSMFHAWMTMGYLFKEIGRRYFLSVRQVCYMYPHEFEDLLLRDKFSASKLNDRYKYSIQLSTGYYKDDTLVEGEEARKILDNLNFEKQNLENIKILIGDCASPGNARGEVAVINKVKDMQKMAEGKVLVSTATNPDLVPAIKKAAVIVTDTGGITCHASIVSRELNIPCVIGTKIATKILKDGDVVDVDATHGKVTIVSRKKS